MYRRNISHILFFFATCLMLFVFYHSWFKPTYLTPLSVPTPDVQQGMRATDFEGVALPHIQEQEIPETRLITLGEAPNPLLADIREDLDKGNFKAVESSLQKAPQNMYDQVPARGFMAGLWNNLGIQQEKYGGIAVSVKAFEHAARLTPDNATVHLNLTQAYWGLRDPALTPAFLGKVIHLAPKDPFPHLALADVLIERGERASASGHLKEGTALTGRDPSLTAYARRLAAQIERASPAPSQTAASTPSTAPKNDRSPDPAPKIVASATAPSPDRVTTPTEPQGSQERRPPGRARSDDSHFTVTFDGQESKTTWTQIQAILEYAYQDIVAKFGHQPTRPIQVVLHSNQAFGSQSGDPAWADSLFDTTTGSIHLPLQGALDDLALVSRILRHQFVHALVHDRMGAQSTGLPRWIVEGLAIQLAEDPWPRLEDVVAKDVKLIPLPTLHGDWQKLSPDQLPVAYWEAMHATKHLTDRYSIYEIRQVMNQIRSGQSFEMVFERKLAVSYEQFQRTWKDSLTKTRASS